MTLRSISANAAWICRKARPAGVVVSMGELRARNPMPRWSSSSMRVMSSPARRRRRDPRTRARSRRRSGRRATGRGPGGLRRWRRGRSRRGSWDGVRCTVSKNPSPAHLIAKRLLRGCRGHFPAKRGSWDVSREHPDKHVFVVDEFRTHGVLRVPLNGPYVACGRPGTPPGHQCAGIPRAAHCAVYPAAVVRDPMTCQVRAVKHFPLDAAPEPPSDGPSNVPSPRSPSDPISPPVP